MARLHQQAAVNQAEVKPRGPLHQVLADAQLQEKGQTPQKFPGPQELPANVDPVRQ